MKILVTGSAGFLGSHLVPRLAREGHEVIGLDIRPERHSRHFCQRDLCDRDVVVSQPFELCIHLASDVGGILHNALGVDIERNELRLLRGVERLCRKADCQRVLYISSINVFEMGGSLVSGPLPTRRLRTPYARAKAAGESFVQRHFESFVIFRPTNLYGADQPSREGGVGRSHVIPDLLRKIREEAEVEVLGDGSQVRNFLHVSDAAECLVKALRNPVRGWFNIRSHLQLTISELARQLLQWEGEEKILSYRPEYMAYEPAPIPLFDISAMRLLGWEPAVNDLRVGLGKER